MQYSQPDPEKSETVAEIKVEKYVGQHEDKSIT